MAGQVQGISCSQADDGTPHNDRVIWRNCKERAQGRQCHLEHETHLPGVTFGGLVICYFMTGSLLLLCHTQNRESRYLQKKQELSAFSICTIQHLKLKIYLQEQLTLNSLKVLT